MANPNVRIKRSSVEGKRPTISQLELGELALNTNDGRLFTRKYNVGIGSTVTLLNVWTENIGGGAYYNDGNIGIGTDNPTSKLTVQGDILVSGVTTSTDFNSASDIKFKENIQPIENPIDKILQINGVSFNWKEDGRSSMGVIAQEVEQIFPELVNTAEYKSVNYNGLIGVLIEVVKELKQEINELRGQINTSIRNDNL